MSVLADMRSFAEDLSAWAGDYARDRMDHDNGIRQKGDGIDLVTEVDLHIEHELTRRINARYPDHAIIGEEHGRSGPPDARWTWMIDPLDGTNNFVMGLPMIGNCITILDGDVPVIGAVRDSVRGITTSAAQGLGAHRDGEPVRIGDFPNLSRTTISWLQGYAVAWNDPFRVWAMSTLQPHLKRVLSTWAPSIDWGLIASGQVGAMVSWRNELHDLLVGKILVTEAGGEVWTSPDDPDFLILGAPDVVRQIRHLLAHGLVPGSAE